MLLPASLRNDPPIDVQGICIWNTGLILAAKVQARVVTRSMHRQRTHGYVQMNGQRIPWCRRVFLQSDLVFEKAPHMETTSEPRSGERS